MDKKKKKKKMKKEQRKKKKKKKKEERRKKKKKKDEEEEEDKKKKNIEKITQSSRKRALRKGGINPPNFLSRPVRFRPRRKVWAELGGMLS